jgi:hypothetical protein
MVTSQWIRHAAGCSAVGAPRLSSDGLANCVVPLPCVATLIGCAALNVPRTLMCSFMLSASALTNDQSSAVEASSSSHPS